MKRKRQTSNSRFVARKKIPEHRRVSIRWLLGICLTGITSCLFMAITLFSAVDIQKKIASSNDSFQENKIIEKNNHSIENKKTRIAATRTRKISSGNTQQIELSTLQKVGEEEVLRSQIFELVDIILAEDYNQNFEYPEFNPLNLFENTNFIPEQLEKSSHIYGSKIETEITLKLSDFPNTGMIFSDNNVISSSQAAQHIKQLGYDQKSPKNLALALANNNQDQRSIAIFSDAINVKIIRENVTSLPKSFFKNSPEYTEDILPVSLKQSFLDILRNAGYEGKYAQRISHVLTIMEKEDKTQKGKEETDLLRLGIRRMSSGEDIIVRVSLYKNGMHQLSIALNDQNQYVQCTEPEISHAIKAALEIGNSISRSAEQLPTVYNAIFQAILAHNMTKNTAVQLIRMLSNDIDMQLHISPDDSLRIFYPLEEQDEGEIKQAIVYVDAHFSNMRRRYYRFQSNDGYTDYYDSDGKSSKKFLLRKPVPNGIFRSPFGPRHHPILGYTKMHSGVDWSAPRGSPIIAAGNGTIIRAGWHRGYGNQIIISHANGYTSSYSHQSSFAKGIQNGMTIKQGQVIGYVGSTGLSTGPHCHFEIAVNGIKVDPMRVHFPDENSLKGEELEAFKRNRDRIDSLIKNNLAAKKIASK